MSSPHGRTFYGLVAVFALAAACASTWRIFTSTNVPRGWQVVNGAIAVIFFLGALQAAERVFRPGRASARFGAMAPASREKLRGTGKSIHRMALPAFFIAIVVRFFGSGGVRDAATDTGIVAAIMVFVAYCVADFCGERLGSL